MAKNNNERINYENSTTPQDEIMNRVNQTYDKIKQDVKTLIDENAQQSNIK